MSHKILKLISTFFVLCGIFIIAILSIQTVQLTFKNKDAQWQRFERLETLFMNQLKMHDELSVEMKEALVESVKDYPSINQVKVKYNDNVVYKALKANEEGKPLYSRNTNLFNTFESKIYSISDEDTYQLFLESRILSTLDFQDYFLRLFYAFFVLSVGLIVVLLIAQKKRREKARPLFVEKPEDEVFENLQEENSSYVVSFHQAVAPEVTEEVIDIDLRENKTTDKEVDSKDLSFEIDSPFDGNDEVSSYWSEDEEVSKEEENDEEEDENSSVIDLNFKDTSFDDSAREILATAIDNNENCVLLMTEFHSIIDERKDLPLQEKWSDALIQEGALVKTEKKKTIALLSQTTLTDGIKLIQDFRDAKVDHEDYAWNAGASALNGRRMRYEDLVNEASRALIKSQLDNDNTVVCFNADAEKYNRFSKINN